MQKNLAKAKNKQMHLTHFFLEIRPLHAFIMLKPASHYFCLRCIIHVCLAESALALHKTAFMFDEVHLHLSYQSRAFVFAFALKSVHLNTCNLQFNFVAM